MELSSMTESNDALITQDSSILYGNKLLSTTQTKGNWKAERAK